MHGMAVVHESPGHDRKTIADLGVEFVKAAERKTRYCDTIHLIFD